jgi:hypothetical protein
MLELTKALEGTFPPGKAVVIGSQLSHNWCISNGWVHWWLLLLGGIILT